MLPHTYVANFVLLSTPSLDKNKLLQLPDFPGHSSPVYSLTKLNYSGRTISAVVSPTLTA